ncbi:ATP-binding protein [Krasilnikovia sp. M28-CT-15]|uniref:ATP-binding protein n=1 Tax=Krasilnikovia sp. M28-CT-15 TaxID=3373540 RepID=UPI0038768BE0
MRTLTVPAVTDSLTAVNELLADLIGAAGMSEDTAYRLRLATEELFVNIVRHGYGPDDADGRVTIEADLTAAEVWVRLIDTAPPFDPFGAPEPTGLDLPLQDREPGSLGLYLTRHSVDAAAHEYVDGANRTTVVFRRETETQRG